MRIDFIRFDKFSNENKFALVDLDIFVDFFGSLLGVTKGKQIIKWKKLQNFNLWYGSQLRKFIAFNQINCVFWQVNEGGFQSLWVKSKMINSLRKTIKLISKSKRNYMA